MHILYTEFFFAICLHHELLLNIAEAHVSLKYIFLIVFELSVILHYIHYSSFLKQKRIANTYCKSFRQPGAKIIEHNGDNVLVRDVYVACFEVHFSCSH